MPDIFSRPLTASEKLAWRAESGCSEVTIAKFLRGAQVRDATRVRLEKAAVALGLPLTETWWGASGRERTRGRGARVRQLKNTPRCRAHRPPPPNLPAPPKVLGYGQLETK